MTVINNPMYMLHKALCIILFLYYFMLVMWDGLRSITENIQLIVVIVSLFFAISFRRKKLNLAFYRKEIIIGCMGIVGVLVDFVILFFREDYMIDQWTIMMLIATLAVLFMHINRVKSSHKIIGHPPLSDHNGEP